MPVLLMPVEAILGPLTLCLCQGVNDVVEADEIDHQQQDTVPVQRHGLDVTCEDGIDLQPVRQAGERIMQGLLSTAFSNVDASRWPVAS